MRSAEFGRTAIRRPRSGPGSHGACRMPRPRVFVSSTHHDLRDLRASLDKFIGSLGFDAVLSEKGNIVYGHDRALDESCYREAENADILVLLIGGRYGSQRVAGLRIDEPDFYQRYDSITKGEYERARARGVPTYVAIDKAVLSELDVYRLNRGNTAIRYAHAASINVFDLIESVMSEPDVSILPFDKPDEVESLLREQWAGHYRELLHRQSELSRLSDLKAQVATLQGVSATLKTYMEAVLRHSDPDASKTLIAAEESRLEALRRHEALRANDWTKFMERNGMALDDYVEAMRASRSFDEFLAAVSNAVPSERRLRLLKQMLSNAAVQRDFNEARTLLGYMPFEFEQSAE